MKTATKVIGHSFFYKLDSNGVPRIALDEKEWAIEELTLYTIPEWLEKVAHKMKWAHTITGVQMYRLQENCVATPEEEEQFAVAENEFRHACLKAVIHQANNAVAFAHKTADRGLGSRLQADSLAYAASFFRASYAAIYGTEYSE